MSLPPRVVIAGTHSRCGKTTVTVGVAAALAAAGHRVATAKVGPDYIDTGYHEAATGRPSRNLDVFMSGESMILPLAQRAAHAADMLVVEGAMGLYDGIGSSSRGSTAHVAKLLYAPVLLVVDASSMSRSVVALVEGYIRHDRDVHVAGIILDRVGSARHEEILRDALSDCEAPVIGAVRRNDDISWPSRHLGLIPAIEYHTEVERSVRELGELFSTQVDIQQVSAIAGTAFSLSTKQIRPAKPVANAVVGYAAGPAFSFVYRDNLERFAEAGADLVPFDPISDSSIPAGAQGLYLGGGFPEVYIEALSSNRPMLDSISSAANDGVAIWAECGGLVLLSKRMGQTALAGVIDAEVSMQDNLIVGYRIATAQRSSFLLDAGDVLHGHEFHRTITRPAGGALAMVGSSAMHAPVRSGFASPQLFASYLHVHLGAHSAPAERFVAAASKVVLQSP
ncbi:MAG: cobyrinate a,c-diamide synthase [Actinobacteria bacterium]|nr:cobyrinate a,c-diamide synthase [Actinomycetota bacterium]